MANYAIFRLQKIKSSASVRTLLDELLPQNIGGVQQRKSQTYDQKRIELNTNSSSAEQAYFKYQLYLPSKNRKNATYGLEFVVSASQEFISDKAEKSYYDAALKFIADNFGKVIGWSIHRDEKSTHMQVITIPLVDGKLNAKRLVGGSKYRMIEIQNQFYEKVGKPAGLERGQARKETQRKHTDVREYNRQLIENARNEAQNTYDENYSILEKKVIKREEKLNEREKKLNKRSDELLEEVLKRGHVNADYEMPKPKFLETKRHFRNRCAPVIARLHRKSFGDQEKLKTYVESAKREDAEKNRTIIEKDKTIIKLQSDIEKLEKDRDDWKNKAEQWKNKTPDELRSIAYRRERSRLERNNGLWER